MKKGIIAVLVGVGLLEVVFGVWLIFRWRAVNAAKPEATAANERSVLSRGGDEAIAAIHAYRKSPKAIVVSYWTAIYLEEYGVAYEYLSSASRESFEKQGGYEKFKEMYEQGHTYFDLGQAIEEVVAANEALVGVQLLEDPAAAQFRIVKEQSEWKIVVEPINQAGL
jgi:hypothetical protein